MVEEYVEAEGDEAQEDANVDFVNELLSNKIT